MQKPNNKNPYAMREPFNRPPRILLSPPQDSIEIPSAPAKEEVPPLTGWWQLAIAFIMITTLISVYLFINHAPAQQITMLVPLSIISILSPIGTIITGKKKKKEVQLKNRANKKAYKQMLTQIHEQLQHYAAEQRRIALLSDPAPIQLEARIKEHQRLWERRPEDPDFLAPRVGIGRRPSSVKISTQSSALDSASEDARTLVRDFVTIDDMPCTISLSKVKSLGISGARQEVAAFTRSLLCQIACEHSPTEVRILAILPLSQRHDWDWLNDMPHTESSLRGCKLPRLTAIGEDEADKLLSFLLEELSQRASRQAEINANTTGSVVQQSVALPHLVVVVHDYMDVHKHPALTNAFKLGEQLGVSIIYLVAQELAIPGECRGIANLTDDGLLNYAATGVAGEKLENVRCDSLDLTQARNIARALGNIQLKDNGSDENDLPTNVRFLDLVELPYADQLDAEKWWEQPRNGMLRVPIGMGLNGPIWLDLNENAHGPHGIIAGTTGSGKSELLQSIIVGLAITHHPHLVNFVLVDFKGGAAFKPFEKIPHTVGMVTDLSGKLTERALVSLKSELKRREHILSAANAKKISEYIQMRAQNPSMEPLPHLFIVIDEFAELAKEHPAFMEGLVSVVQKGRSLGVHLILATQKPTGSVNANIWSNLKFRICLRVASLQDSRDMLGRSEAALLPGSIPGRAYFQIGSEIFDLFQSARISLPAQVVNESAAAKLSSGSSQEVTDMQVLMNMIEPYQATLGEQLFKPWPTPLPHTVSLQEVTKKIRMPALSVPEKADYPLYGWLNCPIGLLDLPGEQKQEPWFIDMARQGGHVLVAGASGTGKSVFLRTLITSLAQTHRPEQLHFYLIDFGGQALRAFEKLPHVGGLYNESDDAYIHRLLRKLNGIIEERKQFCTTNQIDDFLAYQRRRLENPLLSELPAIVLVIDRFIDFKQAYEREMDLLLSIARYGRTYGVYLVLSADRPVAVPMQLMSLIELRIGLRMVELSDSLIFLGKNDAGHLDPTVPGRGYKRGKTLEEIHVALPFTHEDDDEQSRLLDEWAVNMASTIKVDKAQKASPIRLLPEYVRMDYFLMDVVSSIGMKQEVETSSVPQIRLGIEDFSLSPISVELNNDTPHMIIAGGPGSGRTTVLQTCLLMLANPAYRNARIALIDFRRSSRSLRRLPNVWKYADSEERLIETVESLKSELSARVAHIREEFKRMEERNEDDSTNLHMHPIVILIDDYEQITTLLKNPLLDLKEFLLQARDLNLHMILTGGPADIMRSDQLLQQVRACRQGLILGADPNDPQILGVRMSDLPPGRGHLVRRNQRHLIQVAHLASNSMLPWITRLIQAHATFAEQTGTKVVVPEEAKVVEALPVAQAG